MSFGKGGFLEVLAGHKKACKESPIWRVMSTCDLQMARFFHHWAAPARTHGDPPFEVQQG